MKVCGKYDTTFQVFSQLAIMLYKNMSRVGEPLACFNYWVYSIAITAWVIEISSNSIVFILTWKKSYSMMSTLFFSEFLIKRNNFKIYFFSLLLDRLLKMNSWYVILKICSDFSFFFCFEELAQFFIINAMPCSKHIRNLALALFKAINQMEHRSSNKFLSFL